MKEIEQSLFEHYALHDTEGLIAFGFYLSQNVYQIEKELGIAEFSARITVDSSGGIDGVIFEEGEEEYEGFRYPILGSFASSIKEAYVALLKEIRDACYVSVRPRRYYLLPSNPAIYSVGKGFKEQGGYLDWPARKKTHEGDYVFIYSARPFQAIAFLCEVVAVDEAQEGYEGRSVYMTMLHLLKTYDSASLPLQDLKNHGLRTVRFLREIKKELAEYMLSK